MLQNRKGGCFSVWLFSRAEDKNMELKFCNYLLLFVLVNAFGGRGGGDVGVDVGVGGRSSPAGLKAYLLVMLFGGGLDQE